MNHDIDSTERFVAQLRDLKPSAPRLDLQMRLEAALLETKLEAPVAAKIIYHPFIQWSAAAAALITAMLVSVESTEHRAGSPATQALNESISAPEVHQVFQLVGGKLVPSESRATMIPASYRGIQVIEGKAYRRFGDGQQNFLELIESATQQD